MCSEQRRVTDNQTNLAEGPTSWGINCQGAVYFLLPDLNVLLKDGFLNDAGAPPTRIAANNLQLTKPLFAQSCGLLKIPQARLVLQLSDTLWAKSSWVFTGAHL